MSIAGLMTSFVMQYGSRYEQPKVTGAALELLAHQSPEPAGGGHLIGPGMSAGRSAAADAVATIMDIIARNHATESGPTARGDVARYLADGAERADPDSATIQNQLQDVLATISREDDPSLHDAIRDGTVKIVHAGDLGLIYERRIEQFFTRDGQYTGGKATYREEPGFNAAMMVTGDDGLLYDKATGERAGRMQVSGIPFYLTWPAPNSESV